MKYGVHLSGEFERHVLVVWRQQVVGSMGAWVEFETVG